jgi:hypothetical protein
MLGRDNGFLRYLLLTLAIVIGDTPKLERLSIRGWVTTISISPSIDIGMLDTLYQLLLKSDS